MNYVNQNINNTHWIIKQKQAAELIVNFDITISNLIKIQPWKGIKCEFGCWVTKWEHKKVIKTISQTMVRYSKKEHFL